MTIEDGTRVPAGTPFVKTWRVRNEGAPWPPGCQLAYNSQEKHGTSDNMSGPEYVIVEGGVASNVEIEISVPLVAPNKPGRYTGYAHLPVGLNPLVFRAPVYGASISSSSHLCVRFAL